MGVSHSIQLVWGLAWTELVRRDGSHLGDALPPPERTGSHAMHRALDGLIQRPLRVKGDSFSDRWTLGLFDAGDAYADHEDLYVLGIEMSSCHDKDSQLWGRGVEQAEWEARRRCAQDHLQALGIDTPPRLLLVTGSS